MQGVSIQRIRGWLANPLVMNCGFATSSWQKGRQESEVVTTVTVGADAEAPGLVPGEKEEDCDWPAQYQYLFPKLRGMGFSETVVVLSSLCRASASASGGDGDGV